MPPLAEQASFININDYLEGERHSADKHEYVG